MCDERPVGIADDRRNLPVLPRGSERLVRSTYPAVTDYLFSLIRRYPLSERRLGRSVTVQRGVSAISSAVGHRGTRSGRG